jgi:ribosomal protein L39E
MLYCEPEWKAWSKKLAVPCFLRVRPRLTCAVQQNRLMRGWRATSDSSARRVRLGKAFRSTPLLDFSDMIASESFSDRIVSKLTV